MVSRPLYLWEPKLFDGMNAMSADEDSRNQREKMKRKYTYPYKRIKLNHHEQMHIIASS